MYEWSKISSGTLWINEARSNYPCAQKNERNLLKNKRPISLINADLKVACRLLAKRLAKVIGKLISLNQTCIPGRQIFINLHILQDLIDYINSKNQSAAVIFIDAEKAFDRMSHSFLFKTLRQFGCGESFINWIKTIYGHCTARVKVNGFTTSPINIKRGIRQGCPLSSLLYVLCAEVLSLEIKPGPYQNNKIPQKVFLLKDLIFILCN